MLNVEWALLGLGWRRRWDRWKAERHARATMLKGPYFSEVILGHLENDTLTYCITTHKQTSNMLAAGRLFDPYMTSLFELELELLHLHVSSFQCTFLH